MACFPIELYRKKLQCNSLCWLKRNIWPFLIRYNGESRIYQPWWNAMDCDKHSQEALKWGDRHDYNCQNEKQWSCVLETLNMICFYKYLLLTFHFLVSCFLKVSYYTVSPTEVCVICGTQPESESAYWSSALSSELCESFPCCTEICPGLLATRQLFALSVDYATGVSWG